MREFVFAEDLGEWASIQERDDTWLVVEEDFEADRVHVKKVTGTVTQV